MRIKSIFTRILKGKMIREILGELLEYSRHYGSKHIIYSPKNRSFFIGSPGSVKYAFTLTNKVPEEAVSIVIKKLIRLGFQVSIENIEW